MNLQLYQILALLVTYLPLACRFSQDNSSAEGEIYSNADMTALNLTNVSTICKLRIDKSALKNIFKLMHKSTTQVVEIGIFIYSRNETRNFPDLKWAWASEIGRTIISLIAQTNPAPAWYFGTLSRGIAKANIVVFEENYGCLPTGDNATDPVSDLLLRQLSQEEGTQNYKLCHTQSEEISEIYHCCSVTSGGNLTLCSDYSSIVLEYTHGYVIVMTIIIASIALPLILKYLRSFKKESNHYQISESPMALSSICRAIMIEGKGPVKSAQRRLVFSLTVTGILYFSELESTWAVCASVWIIPFTVFDTFATNYDVNEDLAANLILNDNLTDYIAILTLPFNFKCLWNVFKSCFKIEQQNLNYQQIQDNQQNHELSMWRKTCHFFKDIFLMLIFLISFIPICLLVYFLLIFMWLMTVPVPFAFGQLPVILDSLLARGQKFVIIRGVISYLVISFYVVFSVVLIIRSLISLLNFTLLLIAGLYLNGEFYSPIIVPIMILVVYCWKCWRSLVESKYLQLKSKIYEVCKELANETSGLNTEGSIEEIDDCPFTVNIKTGTVSKALYEELRETYLPYDEVLFWFFVRLFLVANFCLFVSVMMLFSQISGISGELQVIGTMAVGTLPFIFDAIWAEHTLEQKQVADMKLKLMLRQVIKFERKIDSVIMVETNCYKKRNLESLNRLFLGSSQL